MHVPKTGGSWRKWAGTGVFGIRAGSGSGGSGMVRLLVAGSRERHDRVEGVDFDGDADFA